MVFLYDIHRAAPNLPLSSPRPALKLPSAVPKIQMSIKPLNRQADRPSGSKDQLLSQADTVIKNYLSGWPAIDAR